MNGGFAVLRPQPGNDRTTERLRQRGADDILRLPLFAVRAIGWSAPDANGFDALVVTSASAIRHGGAALAALASLPVLAVGEATAAASRAAGFTVALTGTENGAALVRQAASAGYRRLLHLAGRDHVPLPVTATIVCYASEPLGIADEALGPLAGRIALIHSPRAARRLRALLDGAGVSPAAITVAALSPAVLAAAGQGWRDTIVAPQPTDAALVACAIDHSRSAADKARHD